MTSIEQKPVSEDVIKEKENGQLIEEDKVRKKDGKSSKKVVDSEQVKPKKRRIDYSSEKVERPARERKSVERFSIPSPTNPPSAGKTLSIVKGNGTLLKEIPNVAFKLSKSKTDDKLQLLHTILFGKKVKAFYVKRNIGQFSGFVWEDNEEKQRAKIKEKLDKLVKDKLVYFCDVLNIPITHSFRKEDVSAKLLDFLESPHATTAELLADKVQKKTIKRKRTPVSSRKRSSIKSSGEKSAKKRKSSSKAEEENETDDKDDNMSSQSYSSGDEVDAMQKLESDEEETSSDEKKDKVEEKKISSKDNSIANSGRKSTNIKKCSSEKSTKSPAKSAKKTKRTPKKSTAVTEASASRSKAKGSSRKKQKIDEETQEEKPIQAEKSTNKKQTPKSAKPVAGKSSKEEKAEPTKEELHAAAIKILKEVDFNTATLSDIIRLLGSHFGLDIMHRKSEVKAIITEVIESMSNEDEEDDGEDGEEEQDSGNE